MDFLPDGDMVLREQLRKKRENADISQEELSKRSGVKISALRQFEQGAVKDPRWSTVKRLAKALGASLDELADKEEDDDGTPSPQPPGRPKKPKQ